MLLYEYINIFLPFVYLFVIICFWDLNMYFTSSPWSQDHWLILNPPHVFKLCLITLHFRFLPSFSLVHCIICSHFQALMYLHSVQPVFAWTNSLHCPADNQGRATARSRSRGRSRSRTSWGSTSSDTTSGSDSTSSDATGSGATRYANWGKAPDRPLNQTIPVNTDIAMSVHFSQCSWQTISIP